MDRSILVSFFDEFEKIAATVLMKALSPKKKALMDMITGFGRQAKAAPAAKGFLSPAATRKAFASSRKEIARATEKLPGMTDADMAARAVQQQAAGRRQQLEHFLRRTGRTSKPGVEKQLESIGGHPRQITRTPAQVLPHPVEQAGLSVGRHVGTSAGTSAGAVLPRRSIKAPTITGFEPTLAG